MRVWHLLALTIAVLAAAFRADDASACSVFGPVLALRTDLDGPIPLDGGLLFAWERYNPRVHNPRVQWPLGEDALALVRDGARIPFVRTELSSGLVVYSPLVLPAAGEWRLEGWHEPRSLAFAAAPPLDPPRGVTIHRWRNGSRGRTWHERVAWDHTPAGADSLEVAWAFRASEWSGRVDVARRSVSFHGVLRSPSQHESFAARWDPTHMMSSCDGVRAADGQRGLPPRGIGMRDNDIAEARWIDRHGRVSPWSGLIRVVAHDPGVGP